MNLQLIDYGTGNIQSVKNALEHIGHSVERIHSPNQLTDCDCLVFPGQGAFGPAIQRLQTLVFFKPINDYVHANKPFLGICLGFQLMFNGSDESPKHNGLSAYSGTFKKFEPNNRSVPHMGWNSIRCNEPNHWLNQFNDQPFYFVHSYYLPTSTEPIQCHTDYGEPFVSAVARGPQLLTQFHPEKSGHVGLDLLTSFFNSL